MPETNNGYCKHHTGIMEALDHIKKTQDDRNNTINRIWSAIEGCVSIKVFMTILTIAVSVVGLIIGVLFYNQDHMLSSLQVSQSATLDRVTDMKVDIEIIKQQMKLQADQDRKDRRRENTQY